MATQPNYFNSTGSIVLFNTMNFLRNARYRAIEFYAAVPGMIEIFVDIFYYYINYKKNLNKFILSNLIIYKEKKPLKLFLLL